MSALSFEKDDDSNGHIDFITAASVSDFYLHVLNLWAGYKIGVFFCRIFVPRCTVLIQLIDTRPSVLPVE